MVSVEWCRRIRKVNPASYWLARLPSRLLHKQALLQAPGPMFFRRPPAGREHVGHGDGRSNVGLLRHHLRNERPRRTRIHDRIPQRRSRMAKRSTVDLELRGCFALMIVIESRTIAVRVVSMAMTGYYKTFRRPRIARPLSFLKYDPIGTFVEESVYLHNC